MPIEMTKTERAMYTMSQHGGGFAKALAYAWLAADPQNRARIEREFSDYVERYSEVADQIERAGNEVAG